jgi:hypothetical protein
MLPSSSNSNPVRPLASTLTTFSHIMDEGFSSILRGLVSVMREYTMPGMNPGRTTPIQ